MSQRVVDNDREGMRRLIDEFIANLEAMEVPSGEREEPAGARRW